MTVAKSQGGFFCLGICIAERNGIITFIGGLKKKLAGQRRTLEVQKADKALHFIN